MQKEYIQISSKLDKNPTPEQKEFYLKLVEEIKEKVIEHAKEMSYEITNPTKVFWKSTKYFIDVVYRNSYNQGHRVHILSEKAINDNKKLIPKTLLTNRKTVNMQP
ncbi:MAG: hypothetical protein ACRC4M_04200 [Mycoplasma sp.]